MKITKLFQKMQLFITWSKFVEHTVMLTGCWQGRDGTDLLIYWSVVTWDVTCYVSCRSAGTWGCARLFVELEWMFYAFLTISNLDISNFERVHCFSMTIPTAVDTELILLMMSSKPTRKM